jgi:hypothetical protein
MGTTVGNIIEMFKHNKLGGKEKAGYLITPTGSIKLFYSFVYQGLHTKRSSMISPWLCGGSRAVKDVDTGI